MSQALTRYQALYESMRARARREQAPQGLDRLAAALRLAWTTRGVTVPWLRAQAQLTDRLEPALKAMGERELDGQIAAVREAMVRTARTRDDELLRRALAVTREVARRVTGQEAYLVQLMGALALARGRVVQMLTGEGKTLTGSIAAPLIAWQRRHLHVFTVNDYLAQRDADSRAPIYKRCLLDCGAIQQEQDPAQRALIYARAIVYGTPKQITADFLRDQIALRASTSVWAGRSASSATGTGPLVPGLSAALVDEADAVLIDEGVVPLIIAQARKADAMAEVYRASHAICASLSQGEDYTIDHVRKRADLTPKGRARARALMENRPQPIWRAPRRAEELVRQALVARHCYLRGRQYEIVDGKLALIDEFTGRFLADRQWEHGLHQSVEAKENLEVSADRETLARISFQRFFRSYPFLCGMTGTAADATGELQRVYQRRVLVIPTHRPVARKDLPARIFAGSDARWNAVADEVQRLSRAGRPVLVGTRSVEASQHVARLLTARAIVHRVLNALVDREEAQIVHAAGARATVTVATNMAGRGTDIVPDRDALRAGGLAVILTEMHGAQRIDRQFMGRAGRQGDPGSSQMFLSLADELPTLHAPRRLGAARALAAGATGELTGAALRLAMRAFRAAQRASQARDQRLRAEVLRQDDWVDRHLPGM
jgi:preprotein translocase subunit SecA